MLLKPFESVESGRRSCVSVQLLPGYKGQQCTLPAQLANYSSPVALSPKLLSCLCALQGGVAGALERSAQRQQEQQQQQQGFAPPPLDRLDGGALRTQLFATPKPQHKSSAAAGSSAGSLLGTPIAGLLEDGRGGSDDAAAATPGAQWALTPGPGAWRCHAALICGAAVVFRGGWGVGWSEPQMVC